MEASSSVFCNAPAVLRERIVCQALMEGMGPVVPTLRRCHSACAQYHLAQGCGLESGARLPRYSTLFSLIATLMALGR